MTQFVGRILRQPYQEKTHFAALDESYVYCLHMGASTIAQQVKKSLEDEGYEGDALGLVVDATGDQPNSASREIHIHERFSRMYHPVRGENLFAAFLREDWQTIRAARLFRASIGKGRCGCLSVRRNLWRAVASGKGDRRLRDRFYSWTLGQSELEKQFESEVDQWEDDARVLNWLVASLPFDYLSFKKLRRIVRTDLRSPRVPRNCPKASKATSR